MISYNMYILDFQFALRTVHAFLYLCNNYSLASFAHDNNKTLVVNLTFPTDFVKYLEGLYVVYLSKCYLKTLKHMI